MSKHLFILVRYFPDGFPPVRDAIFEVSPRQLRKIQDAIRKDPMIPAYLINFVRKKTKCDKVVKPELVNTALIRIEESEPEKNEFKEENHLVTAPQPA